MTVVLYFCPKGDISFEVKSLVNEWHVTFLGLKEKALPFSEGFARVGLRLSMEESSVDVTISSSDR